MAELLSQKEIDQLLSDTLGGGDPGGEAEAEVTETKPEKPKKSKNFKYEVEESFRYKYAYKSPVIKSNKFVFNPDKSIDTIPGKVIVRTLSNYVEHLNFKKGLSKQSFSDLI